MAKRGCFIFLLILILSISFVLSATTTTTTTADETQTKAISCLENKIKDRCSEISTEEKIFSLLAVGKCKTELIADSSSDLCWPSDDCSVKTTSQAILALSKEGVSTTEAEGWLSAQEMSFEDAEWFLQVDANKPADCTVTYSGEEYDFKIDEDKKLTHSAGGCLDLYEGKYWFEIDNDCLDEEFKISCSESFLTSLLYKKEDSSAVYVSEKTGSAPAKGSTTEKVNSVCFEEDGKCDYEGTLWATMVLNYKKKDVSPYIPYLVSMAEDNSEYLPEAFLYILTGSYKEELLSKQTSKQFWTVSGDKVYDTAVALFPFQNEELREKTNAKAWLKEIQGEDGCWDNVRNTAFVLYSLWTKKTIPPTTLPDCEDANFFCMSSASCTEIEGNVLGNYECGYAVSICCDKEKILKTCSAQEGKFCASDEECSNGREVDSSDSSSLATCCLGTCKTISTQSECEENGGFCRGSCLDNEKSSTYSCSSSKTCCVLKESPINNFASSWPIWLIAILIVLVIMGIVFREKLKAFLFKLKLKFKSGKGKPASSSGSPRFPPSSSSQLYPGAVQRRIIPNQSSPRTRLPPQRKTEFDEVLKKLKDMGK